MTDTVQGMEPARQETPLPPNARSSPMQHAIYKLEMAGDRLDEMDPDDVLKLYAPLPAFYFIEFHTDYVVEHWPDEYVRLVRQDLDYALTDGGNCPRVLAKLAPEVIVEAAAANPRRALQQCGGWRDFAPDALDAAMARTTPAYQLEHIPPRVLWEDASLLCRIFVSLPPGLIPLVDLDEIPTGDL